MYVTYCTELQPSLPACVTIAANDDAYGVFSFEISSLATTIQETVGVATDINGEGGVLCGGGGL